VDFLRESEGRGTVSWRTTLCMVSNASGTFWYASGERSWRSKVAGVHGRETICYRTRETVVEVSNLASYFAYHI
jgi:hypothetical protein